MQRVLRKLNLKLFDTVLFVMLFASLILLGKPRVEASTEPPVSGYPHAVGPKKPDKPVRPAPLPFVKPSDKIWVLQGDVVADQNTWYCRASCRSDWEKRTFEVLQFTRGAEDWSSSADEVSACRMRPGSTGKVFLEGGEWRVPPAQPDDSLCFLVIREIPTPPEG